MALLSSTYHRHTSIGVWLLYIDLEERRTTSSASMAIDNQRDRLRGAGWLQTWNLGRLVVRSKVQRNIRKRHRKDESRLWSFVIGRTFCVLVAYFSLVSGKYLTSLLHIFWLASMGCLTLCNRFGNFDLRTKYLFEHTHTHTHKSVTWNKEIK